MAEVAVELVDADFPHHLVARHHHTAPASAILLLLLRLSLLRLFHARLAIAPTMRDVWWSPTTPPPSPAAASSPHPPPSLRRWRPSSR